MCPKCSELIYKNKSDEQLVSNIEEEADSGLRTEEKHNVHREEAIEKMQCIL